MTLLAPAAVAFAALLAVPVVVHLFKPRRVRQTPFSSLRWLTRSPQKLSRRIQWHQLLLFAMRAGFVFLLVLALTRPLWSPGNAPPAGERVIVLDVSRSMGQRTPGRPTPMERARDVAVGLIESAPPGTRTTVLLVDRTARRLGPAAGDAAAVLPELRKVEATAADTDLAAALGPARPLLTRSGRPGELVFVTDNQQGAWDADALATFAGEVPAGTRVRVIDVGVGTAANAWVASARLVEAGEPARRLLRVELAASGGEAQDRTLHVTGVPGGDAVRAVTVEPGRPTVLHLELPADADLRGRAARVWLDPPDALPDDDEYFAALDPRAALRVLLIEPETTGPPATRPGFALRTAIDALAAAGTRSVRLTRRAPATAAAADVSAADVVLLADVPDLPESAAAALDERVRARAGLAVFLGPRAKPDWYNSVLHRPLQPADGLIPLAVGPVAVAPDRLPWAVPTRPHVLLAGLGDPLIGDLAEVTSGRYHRLDGPLPDRAAAIARLPDGTPVLVEHRPGSGTVLLVNASPDDGFSDLPRRKSFVPFVDRLLGELGRGRGREFTAGQPVVLPLEGVNPGTAVIVVGPSEERQSVTAKGEGGHGVLELDALTRPGVYRVEAGGEPLTIAVNAGRGDSALGPTDPASLRAWWKPLKCSVESPADIDSGPPARGPVPLWPAVLVAAAVLLAVETLSAAWLCPRLAPAPTTSLIQQQRLKAGGRT